MRKIENISLVKFDCDFCQDQVGFRPNQIMKTVNKEEVHPFPYTEGWVYVHEFILKLSPIHSINLSRMHFCSESCFRGYIQDQLNKSNTIIKRRKN